MPTSPEQVGAGSMARILKVRHLGLGKDFALKIIHPDPQSKDRLRRHLLREAHVSSQMEHPNIVRVTSMNQLLMVSKLVLMSGLMPGLMPELRT